MDWTIVFSGCSASSLPVTTPGFPDMQATNAISHSFPVWRDSSTKAAKLLRSLASLSTHMTGVRVPPCRALNCSCWSFDNKQPRIIFRYCRITQPQMRFLPSGALFLDDLQAHPQGFPLLHFFLQRGFGQGVLCQPAGVYREVEFGAAETSAQCGQTDVAAVAVEQHRKAQTHRQHAVFGVHQLPLQLLQIAALRQCQQAQARLLLF